MPNTLTCDLPGMLDFGIPVESAGLWHMIHLARQSDYSFTDITQRQCDNDMDASAVVFD